MSEAWPVIFDEGYTHQFHPEPTHMEHLSNDHEGHPIVNMMESQWKLKQHDRNFPILELFLNCSWIVIESFWNYSGIVLVFRVFENQLFRLKHFQLPDLDLLLVVKYFNSAQGNLNSRSIHPVTVSPNWSWMSFSKHPYLFITYFTYLSWLSHFPWFPWVGLFMAAFSEFFHLDWSCTILGAIFHKRPCPWPWPLTALWSLTGKKLFFFYWALHFSSSFLLMKNWPRIRGLGSKNNWGDH